MNYGFETRCIHGNGTDEKTHSYGSVAVPIYQAATFAHPGIGQSTGYDYTRESNPTRTELEHTMSALEGAVDTVACANGMAAVGLCLELFDRGDHILVQMICMAVLSECLNLSAGREGWSFLM